MSAAKGFSHGFIMEKMADKDGELVIKSDEPEDEGLRAFIWNPNKGEFCGRNGSSWLKIGIFYVIFYFLLAGFWVVMLLVFYQTLDYYSPKWTLDASRIGTNPGLCFRPLPHPDNVDSTLIWFTHGSAREWDYWVKSLGKFLDAYEPGRQTGEYLQTCITGEHYTNPHVCPFDLDSISKVCSRSNNFGYDVGKPCVLIKINRIYGWLPEPYRNDSLPSKMPDHIRASYNPNNVYISCAGENPADMENIGPIEYFPSNGTIDNYYFPFTNLDGYLSPFVWVHFQKPATGVLINIECKAWASNIQHDRTDRKGSVHFELLID